ncbi:hypothetical protein JAAARDRAFT_44639 [Jaapia argillacea MUCL 33604]|uniref:BHLH domain-containing protein n=1 Tax=Jaapia argillacea MUCL 33604 TaxID=933084 RepID=A0A067QHQ4_9AGAM|nr:hypothetical protein JAAARDRAFT_44639 [Jaapia argillacea MUCL 33604]
MNTNPNNQQGHPEQYPGFADPAMNPNTTFYQTANALRQDPRTTRQGTLVAGHWEGPATQSSYTLGPALQLAPQPHGRRDSVSSGYRTEYPMSTPEGHYLGLSASPEQHFSSSMQPGVGYWSSPEPGFEPLMFTEDPTEAYINYPPETAESSQPTTSTSQNSPPRSGSGEPQELRDMTPEEAMEFKRVARVRAEGQRRNTLKRGMSGLKEALPEEFQRHARSKNSIVNAAAQCIESQTREQELLERRLRELDDQIQRQRALQEQIVQSSVPAPSHMTWAAPGDVMKRSGSY